MSMGFIKNGKYVQVAGNPPPSGELVMGASTIRKGTVTIATQANNVADFSSVVTFDSPMPDADYILDIVVNTTSWHLAYHIQHKSKTGFAIQGLLYPGDTASHASETCTLTYTAAKLYTVEDVAELEAKVAELEANNEAKKTFISLSKGVSPVNSSYMHLSDVHYDVRNGIVIVYIWFSTKTEIPANTILYTNLPKNVGGPVAFAVNNSSSHTYCGRLHIDSNATSITTIEPIPASTILCGELVYFTEAV